MLRTGIVHPAARPLLSGSYQSSGVSSRSAGRVRAGRTAQIGAVASSTGSGGKKTLESQRVRARNILRIS